jgi:hypothetical protein
VESTASLGNWSDGDKVRIASLKLTDTARLFYSTTTELHETDVTRSAFKTAFEERFKDPRTAQHHFIQLQTARQKKGKCAQDFADRVRGLAQNVTPKLSDPAAQRIQNEQVWMMMFASCFRHSRDTRNPGEVQVPKYDGRSHSHSNGGRTGGDTGAERRCVLSG